MLAEGNHLEESQSSYRSIFKATSLFGGVQVYTILIQIIKSKVIAVLLGPFGVGLQGLYQSALDLVRQATSLGISQSAVRDVAEANGSGDLQQISRRVTVLRRIVWFTGLLGLVAVVLFSHLLSETSFGDNGHIIPFVLLSIILLLDQLSAGQKVVLQGMRRLRDLAKATALGATASLAFSLPLYYLWGVEGVVPAMILTAAVTLLVSWYYSHSIAINHVSLDLKEIFREGKSMMVMGISMSLSGVLSMGAGFLIRSLIRKWGGVDEVGLFQAGFVIINSYVALVFNAISTDYYPRLAAVNKDNSKCREVVSQQGEISVHLLAPLLAICILAMPLVIRLLYSEQFLPANGFIKWACLGMLFRLVAWLVSFMFMAKAESKLFVINELVGSLNYLWISLLGYKLGGLTGLGIAFVVNYIVYFIQVFSIARYRYGFKFSDSFTKDFQVQLLLVGMSLCSILFIPGLIKYVIGFLFVAFSCIESMKRLNERTNFKQAIYNRLQK